MLCVVQKNKMASSSFEDALRGYDALEIANNYNTDIELIRLRVREKELAPEYPELETLRLKIQEQESMRQHEIRMKELSLPVEAQLELQRLKTREIEVQLELQRLKTREKLELERKTTKTTPATETAEPEKEPETVVPEEPKKEPNKETVPAEKASLQGPWVQQYNKNHELVRVFPTITDVTRDIRKASYSAVKQAVKTRTEYKNSRWFFVDRDQDPNKTYDIGPTVETQERKTGFVCLLNKEKTVVEQVFAMQKQAAEYIGQHTSAVSTAIKHDRVLSDKRFAMWDSLEHSLRQTFSGELPGEHHNVRGNHIERLCPKSGEVLETYHSFAELEQKFKTSAKTVKAAIQKDTLFRGYKWNLKN